ncbi:two component transcriptional regulator, LytTR family [Flavobacteriaceae bacterium 3519-10]|nr:two component transcriptional regulator, LytTR family [Flavobacteriaceae bacterium 3519-10]
MAEDGFRINNYIWRRLKSMNPSFFERFKSKSWLKHVVYWTVFVLFFGFVWGVSDHSYSRNMLIQVFCLPSRMVLVYVTLFYLFPMFFSKKKYFSFFISYCVLVALISVFIQRPLALYFIQPHFLPGFKNTGYFVLSEIMNTALDINIAAMIPLAYTYLTQFENLQRNNSELNEENRLLKQNATFKDDDKEYINFKIDKSIRKVRISEIVFVESLRNYCRIKLDASEFTVLKTLTSVQELLPGSQFVRIHRSFVVNKQHITSVSASRIEISDITVPVGRKYKEDVKRTLLTVESAQH